MTIKERAEAVLRARGWGVAVLYSCTPAEIEALAEMATPEGQPLPGLQRELERWLERYYAARKAASD